MKVALIIFFYATAARALDHTVTMKSMSFEPKILDLKSGDSVIWVNKSYSKHSAIFENSNYDSGEVRPNKSSRKVVFSKPGTYPYHCKIHGQSMSATVEVK